MKGQTNEGREGRRDELKNGQTDTQTDRRMDGWMDGWIEG